MFQVKNLNLIYDVDKEEKVCAVNDVTLTLPDTGLIGIIGPSGSGKSSLMYCLSTLKTPTDGSIVYNGTDYRRKFHFAECHEDTGKNNNSKQIVKRRTADYYCQFFERILKSKRIFFLFIC